MPRYVCYLFHFSYQTFQGRTPRAPFTSNGGGYGRFHGVVGIYSLNQLEIWPGSITNATYHFLTKHIFRNYFWMREAACRKSKCGHISTFHTIYWYLFSKFLFWVTVIRFQSVMAVRDDLGVGALQFARHHPFSSWLSSMVVCFAGDLDFLKVMTKIHQ